MSDFAGLNFMLNPPVAVGLAIGIVGLLVLIYLAIGRGSGDNTKKQPKAKKKSRSGSSSSQPPASPSAKQNAKKNKEFKYSQKKGGLVSHPLSAADFKGHTDFVSSIAFEPGGKYLVSCSDDRTVRVWWMKTVEDREHKYTRLNIEDNDHATNVAFSPDGTAVAMTTSHGNSVVVYKLGKSKGALSLATALEFELTNETIDDDVLCLEIAPNGRYIMTCTKSSISLWTLKGANLVTIETRQSPNNCATISKCSRFIACCGFTTDVKIWEVEFSKSDEFQKVNRAMELKGHSAGVVSVCFSQDSKRAVTLSKDRTCKLWNIDVRYALNEDPRVLLSIDVSFMDGPSKVALSPDSLVVAVAAGGSIATYATYDGSLLETLLDVHNSSITCLLFEPNGQYIVSAGGHDRFIRLWHNAPGMRELVRDLKERMTKTTSETMKERLVTQLNDLERKLASLSTS